VATLRTLDQQIAPLSYAVRLRVVLKYAGQLSIILAGLTVVPAAVALVGGSVDTALRYLLVTVLLATFGVATARLPAPARLLPHEALVTVALGFLVTPLLMALPLCSAGLPFLDAWFEAVSAVTTTGLSTVDALAEKPFDFLFARAWMQWYGGLGIIVLCLALLLRPGPVSRYLASSGLDSEDLVGSTRENARRVLAVYLALTVATFLLLWLVAKGDARFALLHALTSVSTGGMAPADDSLASVPGPARVAVLGCSVAGAVALVVYYRAWQGDWRVLIADPQLRALLLATAVTTLLLAGALHVDGEHWSHVFRHAPLLAASAQSTTGFSTLDIAALGPPATLVLILAMFIGGGLGSSAGGIKLLRFLIFLRLLHFLLARTRLPSHAVAEPRLAGHALRQEEAENALTVILLFVAVVVLSWLVFVAAGCEPMDALFEVTSATGTVGLSSGLTAPELRPGLKLLLCADMLLGRLEIVALLVVFHPATWIGKRLKG
jgi:trk system potassium uptake protein TrkH